MTIKERIEYAETKRDEAIKNDYDSGTISYWRGYIYGLKAVAKAAVVEVVHASWNYGKVCGQPGYYCTNCKAGFVGENAEWIAKEHDFCPKCGAKMDGERREGK